MKKLVFPIVIIAIGLYGHKTLGDNPSEIENPVYLESRVNFEVPDTSRELEFVFMGEMVSLDDCTERRGNYLEKLLENCQDCTIKFTECKLDIHSRYKKLFSNRKAHTTYLSLTKGNRFERNGRIVVWGLNDEEARLLCSDMKGKIESKYNGATKCI